MAKRRTELPKGVWFQRKRLASGEVVRYGYYGRGPGTEPLGLEGSQAFHARLAEAMQRAPEEHRVAFVVHQYLRSPEFGGLAPRTQADYRGQLDRIRTKFGTLSLRAMAAPIIARDIYAWRDQLALSSPKQADYAMAVLGVVLGWGVRRGYLDYNRAAGIERVYKPDRRENVWSEEQEAAFLEAAPEPIRRVFILAVETGLSQQDVLALPWSAVQGNIIVTRRQKNGTPVAIPISPRLRDALDKAPRGASVTVITRTDGLPYTPRGNGIRTLFAIECARAGIRQRTFHDLRGTFITRRRALGWTAEETALCSGHKVANEKGAQGAYVDRTAVAKANADRLWHRYYGPQGEQNLQTGLQTDLPKSEVSR